LTAQLIPQLTDRLRTRNSPLQANRYLQKDIKREAEIRGKQTHTEAHRERGRDQGAANQRLTIDMVFSGRAATGGGATSRSASLADVAAAGEDVLYAF